MDAADMTPAELIQKAATEARLAGSFVAIDWMLPSLLIYIGPGNEKRWTCKEASEKLMELSIAAGKIGAPLKNYIMAKAQEI